MMAAESNGKRYHPLLRAMTWAVPLAALAVIAGFMLAGNGGGGSVVTVTPPASARISPVGMADIDSIIAGGSEAFRSEDYDEAARLLSRARFFIRSGISEGKFEAMPTNLDLVLGLSEFYRGYPDRAVAYLSEAAREEPGDCDCALYLGLVHLSRGEKKPAREFLERAAASDDGGECPGLAKKALGGM